MRSRTGLDQGFSTKSSVPKGQWAKPTDNFDHHDVGSI